MKQVNFLTRYWKMSIYHKERTRLNQPLESYFFSISNAIAAQFFILPYSIKLKWLFAIIKKLWNHIPWFRNSFIDFTTIIRTYILDFFYYEPFMNKFLLWLYNFIVRLFRLYNLKISWWFLVDFLKFLIIFKNI